MSFGAAGRASIEVDQRVERIPPARSLKPRSGSRAVGLVLLFVVAGPVLAVAMCIAIDLPGITVNGVRRDRASALDRIDLTETVGLAFPRSVPFANGSGDRPSGFVSDAIALDADNATRMLDAMLVTEETRFGLYDDGNQTNANVTSASFTGSSATGVNSQVGRPSAQPVPEPSTVLLLGGGLMALAVRRKRLALGGRGGQARHGTFSRLATPGGSGPE